jgi:hypothetical protein
MAFGGGKKEPEEERIWKSTSLILLSWLIPRGIIMAKKKNVDGVSRRRSCPLRRRILFPRELGTPLKRHLDYEGDKP